MTGGAEHHVKLSFPPRSSGDISESIEAMYLLRVSPNSSIPLLLAIPKQSNFDGMHMTLIFSNQFLTTTSNPLNLPANIWLSDSLVTTSKLF